jgi:hypothetical protein
LAVVIPTVCDTPYLNGSQFELGRVLSYRARLVFWLKELGLDR